MNTTLSRYRSSRHGLIVHLLIALFFTPFLRSVGQMSTNSYTLSGPFTPGSGNWTPVPGGDFELGPSNLPVNATYGPLTGDMELFESVGSSGTAQRSALAAYNGSMGVDIKPGAFNGSGIAVTYYKLISVPAGQSVVLSGFIKRLHPVGSAAKVYLDFWGVPGSFAVPVSTNTSDWQFVYGVFTPAPGGVGSVNIGARIGVDGNVTPNDEIYADDLAVTPLSQFVPPHSNAVSEARGTALVDNGFVVGIQLTSGGSGYTNVPGVAIVGGGGSGATAVATVAGGVVTGIQITSAGIGYSGVPIVLIQPPRPAEPTGANATATINGGFVVAVNLVSPGGGYTKVPAVQLIGGGGTGARATAVIANGIVTGVVISNAGIGYTSAPLVIIDPPVYVAPPPFSVAVAVKTVTVTLSVAAKRVYILQSSEDLTNWTTLGNAFVSESTLVAKDVDVAGHMTFFRLRDVTYGP